MSEPPLRYSPGSLVVVRGWLRTVLDEQVGVDIKLPDEVTAGMRSAGFVVIDGIVGGSLDSDVPFWSPVAGLRCWVAPTETMEQQQWGAAERLVGWVIDAAYAHPVEGVRLDLAGLGLGAYRPPRVHSVVPVSLPRDIRDDPGNYAGFDLDLLVNWTES